MSNLGRDLFGETFPSLMVKEPFLDAFWAGVGCTLGEEWACLAARLKVLLLPCNSMVKGYVMEAMICMLHHATAETDYELPPNDSLLSAQSNDASFHTSLYVSGRQDFLPEIYDMYNPSVKAASDAYSSVTGALEAV
eukprot:1136792-Pelagomonas_calceolata.AAC.3